MALIPKLIAGNSPLKSVLSRLRSLTLLLVHRCHPSPSLLIPPPFNKHPQRPRQHPLQTSTPPLDVHSLFPPAPTNAKSDPSTMRKCSPSPKPRADKEMKTRSDGNSMRLPTESTIAVVSIPTRMIPQKRKEKRPQLVQSPKQRRRKKAPTNVPRYYQS